MPPIGEGSQVEILQATGTLQSGKLSLLAMKAYADGISISDLQLLWPCQLMTDCVGHLLWCMWPFNLIDSKSTTSIIICVYLLMQ